MTLLLRYMGPAGFRGTNWQSGRAASSHYYKKYIGGEIICVSNLCPWHISMFQLNPKQFRAFCQGKLSLVPPGCCNVGGGCAIERCKILRSQEPVDHAEVIAFIREMEAKYNLQ